jgi:D-tyrosyl-tRNA(Tyr) deacylase
VRAVAQRVSRARVRVDAETVAEMGAGLLALVGVAREDDERAALELARRLVGLRVFEDDAGRMNRSLLETGGTLGVVPNFTLQGDAREGRRPSFAAAAAAGPAERLIGALVARARELGAPVVTGRFGARMQVEIANEGPVTILLDTARRF